MPFTFQYALHEMLQQRSYHFSPVMYNVMYLILYMLGTCYTPFD